MGKHKDKKATKHRKDKYKERRYSLSSDSDEWVEKTASPATPKEPQTVIDPNPSARDEWMALPTTFTSSSHLQRRSEKEANKRLERENDKYNPGTNVRELNPYWKQGGDGLPTFKKPTEDYTEDESTPAYSKSQYRRPGGGSNWRKTTETITKHEQQQQSPSPSHDDATPLTDAELNALGARLVKAEIMGDAPLILELQLQLANARKQRERPQEIILTHTDFKGYTRPIRSQRDEYGECSGTTTRLDTKKRKVETHVQGERVRYFPDDEKTLKQMFEEEKCNGTGEEQAREFMRIASKMRKNDDLEDVFTDDIRKKESDGRIEKRNRDQAINEYQNSTLDNCTYCIQSAKMLKHLLISMGETFYLCVPPYEPLTPHHCLLVPTRHVSCSTHLDENEWTELVGFRRALTRMFDAHDHAVVFFETAMLLHRHPHMAVHCVPIARAEGDLAPIYFKKAIDESETEWASNKKLVSLAGRDVRKAIPKGLPYFAVSFGMEEGFAHVIEDQRIFPANFAQEIIGGILDLHHSRWRKPKMQSFDEQRQRVGGLTKAWADYDCTSG